MRPERLEVVGFTSFRERAEIDFGGADVFAFTGPTGSGKSSLVDAMVFALYGAVPRLANRGAVAPVISSGAAEAKVRLDFAVGDDHYTAVRVVRRTKTGASTKEARLEHDGEVIAGSEAELTKQIEALLGLSFEHFCRCVVLPQGEFARFLHDKPKDRQDLLVGLLDLGFYGRMMMSARQRANAAERDASVIEQRLAEEFGMATEGGLVVARARVERIGELADVVRVADADLARIDAEIAAADEDAARAAARVKALRGVRMPADAGSVSARAAAAATRAKDAADALHEAEVGLEQAGAAAAALGSRIELERTRELHRRRLEAMADVAERRTAAAEAARQATAKEGAATAAAEALSAAHAALEAARAANRAAALVPLLEAGEPCPVCRQKVTAVPAVETPADFHSAQTAVDAAATMAKQADAARQAAMSAAAEANGALAAVESAVAELAAQLDGAMALPEIESGLQAIVAAESVVAAATLAARAARTTAREASEAADAARAAAEAARTQFDAVWSDLAPMGAPKPGRTDLGADWTALAEWATSEMVAAADAAAGVDARRDELTGRRSARFAEVAAACAEAGVVLGPKDHPGQKVAAAAALAANEVAQLEKAIARAGELRVQADELRSSAAVASALATHLDAKHFEQWLLNEALSELCEAGTLVMQELSQGAYSLILEADRGDFAVVDHRNADDVRGVRTLSGGETFLASLSLALALADRVAGLAASGAARLESLFLDEGFGTLDPDTLDVVATAIENLASRGRSVGVVTHVAELAERVPVRFEVRKGPHTSTVERRDA